MESGGAGGSRALGFALAALGFIVGLVLLAWLGANYADGALETGGLICGLGLLVAFALPLLLSGLYLLSRARAEAGQAQRFQESRAVLHADLLLRQQLSAELDQLISRLKTQMESLPGGEAARAQLDSARERLAGLWAAVGHQGADEMAMLSAIASAPRDATVLHSYDTLLLERGRQLSRQVAELGQRPGVSVATQVEDLFSTLDSLEEAFQQRQDLLLHGRRPAGEPLEMLKVDPMIEETGRLLRLGLGDVVAHEGVNYLVQGKLTYFSNGRTWRVFLLRDGRGDRWLQVSESGAELALFEPAPEVDWERLPSEVELSGERFKMEARETASVTVETESGTRPDIFVVIWRLTSSSNRLLWVERWPEHTVARAGRGINIFDLQTFSRTR